MDLPALWSSKTSASAGMLPVISPSKAHEILENEFSCVTPSKLFSYRTSSSLINATRSGVGLSCVLRPAIRMNDAARSRASVLHGGSECRQGQRRIDVARDRVAHHLAAASIQNGHQIAEPRGNPDGAGVRHPYHVGLSRDDIAAQVWEDRRVMPAVGGAHKAPARLDAEALSPHHARATLVIDHLPTSAQFVCHAPVAIARQLVLNAVDQSDEAPIVQALAGRRRQIGRRCCESP